MPTKEYTNSLLDFCSCYNIDYDPNDLKTNKKILKTLGKNNLAPISNNPAANSYFDALTSALTLYVQKKVEVGDLRAYDIFSGDSRKSVYLSDFIIAFELMMQDKFKSDFSDGKERLLRSFCDIEPSILIAVIPLSQNIFAVCSLCLTEVQYAIACLFSPNCL